VNGSTKRKTEVSVASTLYPRQSASTTPAAASSSVDNGTTATVPVASTPSKTGSQHIRSQ
jgi:hypothetical protein